MKQQWNPNTMCKHHNVKMTFDQNGFEIRSVCSDCGMLMSLHPRPVDTRPADRVNAYKALRDSYLRNRGRVQR